MTASQSGKKFICLAGRTTLYRSRKSSMNPNFHNECFRLCAERHSFATFHEQSAFDLLCGTKMTESKIHFTTACDKVMTSWSCDWVESNTVSPNFFIYASWWAHRPKNYMWSHLKSVQSLARRSPMLFGLWKELCFTLNAILKCVQYCVYQHK
jgi:hypothetical protein